MKVSLGSKIKKEGEGEGAVDSQCMSQQQEKTPPQKSLLEVPCRRQLKFQCHAPHIAEGQNILAILKSEGVVHNPLLRVGRLAYVSIRDISHFTLGSNASIILCAYFLSFA